MKYSVIVPCLQVTFSRLLLLLLAISCSDPNMAQLSQEIGLLSLGGSPFQSTFIYRIAILASDEQIERLSTVKYS
jgi:hypothetical protein